MFYFIVSAVLAAKAQVLVWRAALGASILKSHPEEYEKTDFVINCTFFNLHVPNHYPSPQISDSFFHNPMPEGVDCLLLKHLKVAEVLSEEHGLSQWYFKRGDPRD